MCPGKTKADATQKELKDVAAVSLMLVIILRCNSERIERLGPPGYDHEGPRCNSERIERHFAAVEIEDIPVAQDATQKELKVDLLQSPPALIEEDATQKELKAMTPCILSLSAKRTSMQLRKN